jgi:hypothetical protein
MIILQIDNLANEQEYISGILDNLIWPIIVSVILGVGGLIWKKITTKKKKETRPKIKLSIDKKGKILPISDKKFKTKIQLAKQITRETKQKGLLIEITPNYVTRHLDKFAKDELKLKLKSKSNEIEKKIEILLMRPIEPGLEHPDNLKTTINSILVGQPFNVTGTVKIDLYRNHEPKLNFPVYVTDTDFQIIAQEQNKTIEGFKKELLIPTLCSVSIFNNELMYKQVIPEMIQEIYRIHSRHNFDLNTRHWENILLYEVGLG